MPDRIDFFKNSQSHHALPDQGSQRRIRFAEADEQHTHMSSD